MTILGDVVDMTFGFAFKSVEFTREEDGIRLLRGDNVAQGTLRWDDARLFPSERASEFERYLLRKGDVVLAMDRPWIEAGLKYAVVRASDTPSLLVQRVARLRAKAGLDQGYLAAVIGSRDFTDHVLAVQTGSAVPHISGKQIGEFHLGPLPPIEVQRGIAATLGALDDKIESNRRAIIITEALGATLVEVEFSLDAYGFPKYDDRRLGDFLSVIETGSRPKGGVSVGLAGVPSLGAENIQSAGISTAKEFKRVPVEYARSMKRGRLVDEDILVYKDGGTPGNFTPHVSAFGFGFPINEATINEHVYRIRAGEGISQGLLYWLLRSPWMDQEMRKRGTGVAIPGLNSANFRDLPFPVLSDTQRRNLNQVLNPMLASMLRFGAEIRKIEALRDTLLPELLSGRIRVPEAAEMAEEAIA